MTRNVNFIFRVTKKKMIILFSVLTFKIRLWKIADSLRILFVFVKINENILEEWWNQFWLLDVFNKNCKRKEMYYVQQENIAYHRGNQKNCPKTDFMHEK